jgi:hypothetical protein
MKPKVECFSEYKFIKKKVRARHPKRGGWGVAACGLAGLGSSRRLAARLS